MKRFLASPRLPLVAAALAILLCAPSLRLGYLVDDYYLRLALQRPSPVPEWSRSPLDVFSFFHRDPSVVHGAIETGAAPWWTDSRLQIAFFRPLTGLTHWLDFRLWPSRPWAMHLQSLLWFGAAIAAAALLYRRLLQPVWVGGLAALLFAVDDAHGMPACWLANRNATTAALFGILALVAYDRWRRDGWRPGAVAAPAALALSLLAGEGGLGVPGYLVAYALFLDPARPSGRIRALVPAGLVVAAWAIVYRGLGYGVSGSAMYIDPATSPAAFVRAVAERAPLLLSGQWVFPSGFHSMFSREAAGIAWWAAVGSILAIALLVAPIVRRDPTARFFALGLVLSVLPACGTFPDDRVLFLVGIGGMGLLAQLVGALAGASPGLSAPRAWRPAARIGAALLLVTNLLLAPLALAGSAGRLRTFGDIFERLALSLPADPAVSTKTALIVGTPSAFVSAYGPLISGFAGRPVPGRAHVLGAGIHAIEVRRPEREVLLVRPAGGYLAPPGTPDPGDDAPPAFDPRYMLQVFDSLYRNTPMRVGDRIELPAFTVEVTEVTGDGRPAEARFRFATDLEDPSLLWLTWHEGVLRPFELPAVGARVVLPPAAIPL